MEGNRMRAEEDWEGLAKLSRPKAHFFITQPTLIHQTAHAVASFSPLFDVYVYGGESDKKEVLPQYVNRVPGTLHAKHELLDPDNEATSHVVIVVSYSTFAARHGPQAVRSWLVEKKGRSTQKAKETCTHLPRSFPHKLDYMAGWVILDECQAVKKFDSYTSISIRWLAGQFHVLMTATPVPWAHSDYGGILSFLQDPSLNEEYKTRVCDANVQINPYLEGSPDAKYRATYAAFSDHCHDKLSHHRQGNILSLVWKEVMIRRTYYSSMVTHPDGTRHVIGNLLPKCTPIRVTIKSSNNNNKLYASAAEPLLKNLISTDEETSMPHLHGGNVRLLNLFSTNPLFAFAKSIASVKDNPVIEEFAKLHDSGNYAGYLHKLLVDIKANADAANASNVLPIKAIPPLNQPSTPPSLVQCFAWRSERLRAMLALFADWVAEKKEKVIVFTSSPTEQEYINCILNCVGIKSRALMARLDQSDKVRVIDLFNTPLSAWDSRARPQQAINDTECLVLTVNQNAGLNFQNQCSSKFLPAPSLPLSACASGRCPTF